MPSAGDRSRIDLCEHLDQSSRGRECLQECAHLNLSLIAIRSAMLGQSVLHECWRSGQRWLTPISLAMAFAMSGKGGFELRGVVEPLVLCYRHLALLARPAAAAVARTPRTVQMKNS